MQLDGFYSDSLRMIQAVRREAQQRVQMLLFSATFNENVKRFALKVARDDGREEANEVISMEASFSFMNFPHVV